MADTITIKAKKSPRFEGNTIKWYNGNTFQYTLTFNIVDEATGEDVEILPEHKIVVGWFNKRGAITEFVFDNLTPYLDENGNRVVSVVIDMDEEKTALFDVGTYTYCIKYYGEFTTTVGANMTAEVEKCH